MSFTSADPDFRARVEQSFQLRTAVATLGIHIESVAPSKVTLGLL